MVETLWNINIWRINIYWMKERPVTWRFFEVDAPGYYIYFRVGKFVINYN